MALYFSLDSNCTQVVDDVNYLLSTKHTNLGNPSSLLVYLFNDGARTGVDEEISELNLVYTNVELSVNGYSHTVTAGVNDTSTITIQLDSTDGWGEGTIVQSAAGERMRVEKISGNSVRVTRNYTADGGISVAGSITQGSLLIPETDSISFAPVEIGSTIGSVTPGAYLAGGETMKKFLAPTTLANRLTTATSANSVQVSDGSWYNPGCIIQIDDEQMRVVGVNGNTLTVVRGYNLTSQANHEINSTVYLVGITAIKKAYPFYIKNDPPAGLPTQIKKDVKIKISADEEPYV